MAHCCGSKGNALDPICCPHARCDLAKFDKDIDSEPIAEAIKADQEEGTKLGVQNTPSIFLNDTEVPPASLDPIDLRAAVESALRGTVATPTPKPEKLPQ